MKPLLTKYLPALFVFLCLGFSSNLMAQAEDSQPSLSAALETKQELANRQLTEPQKLKHRISTLTTTKEKLEKRIIEANKQLAIKTASGELSRDQIEAQKKSIKALETQSDKLEKLIAKDKAALGDQE
ncbi:MAG: hypothetical protein AAFV80_00340 [Bacteroidota bacterium]